MNTHTHTHIHNCEQVEPFVNGVAMNKAGWCENAASEVISIGSQGGDSIFSEAFSELRKTMHLLSSSLYHV